MRHSREHIPQNVHKALQDDPSGPLQGLSPYRSLAAINSSACSTDTVGALTSVVRQES